MSNTQVNPVAVLGVPIDNVTMDDVIARIEQWVEEGGFHQVATANTDFLINALKDAELGDILRRCDLVIADGMPLVWTSRLLGTPLKGRVTGVDLVPRLAELSARRNFRIFMLGATQKSLDGSAAWIEAHYPGAQIVGRLSPPHGPLADMDHEEILGAIEEARPDILLVAFGNPKQEKWLSMHRHRLQVPVCVGVGGSFDFLSGSVQRAPEWMQRSGLEWAYRTMQEPTRLAKRYLHNAVGLLTHLPQQLATYAIQGKQSFLPQLTVEMAGDARILHVTGDFTGPVMARFEEESDQAFSSGAHLVLDLSRSSYIGPDALGLIIRLMGKAKLLKREFWLTGLKPLVGRVVRAARLGPSLRIAPGVTEAMQRMEPAEFAWTAEVAREWTSPRISTKLVPFKTAEEAVGSKSAAFDSGRSISGRRDTFRDLVHGTSAIASDRKHQPGR